MSMTEIVKLPLTGLEILNDPMLNKGTAFTQEERDAFHLNGLLPPKISLPEDQIRRTYYNYSQKKSPMEKYDALIGLMSRNEHLFYQFALRYVKEIVPIIYTPTVGEAAQNYSRIYFHQKGLYLSYPMKDRLDEIIASWPEKEVAAIVVTDGERILGLGDQGIGGMTIPIGKLSLYTLCGGIHPARTLPIILDVGTNNPSLIDDPFYLGWHHARLDRAEYDAFVELFVKAIKKRFPKVLLQWEDFGKENARRLLDKYRDQILSFNDDIQGTAAVTLGGLLAAVKSIGQKLSDQTIAILGGGSAGTGIADIAVQAMQQEGLSLTEARQKIFIIDIDGLIRKGSSHINEAQAPYTHDWQGKASLLDVVTTAKPTILIGVCAQGGAFTKEIVQQMAKNAKRPIIFPLSNPTSRAECTASDAIQWTNGQAIIGTGSPFDPVTLNGKTHIIGQCNNVYIFPGMALGVISAKASKVTDEMFLAAARTLAENSPVIKDPNASLFPPIEDVRKVSRLIAIAVAKLAGVPEKAVDANIWDPHYPKYVPS